MIRPEDVPQNAPAEALGGTLQPQVEFLRARVAEAALAART